MTPSPHPAVRDSPVLRVLGGTASPRSPPPTSRTRFLTFRGGSTPPYTHSGGFGGVCRVPPPAVSLRPRPAAGAAAVTLEPREQRGDGDKGGVLLMGGCPAQGNPPVPPHESLAFRFLLNHPHSQAGEVGDGLEKRGPPPRVTPGSCAHGLRSPAEVLGCRVVISTLKLHSVPSTWLGTPGGMGTQWGWESQSQLGTGTAPCLSPHPTPRRPLGSTSSSASQNKATSNPPPAQCQEKGLGHLQGPLGDRPVTLE